MSVSVKEGYNGFQLLGGGGGGGGGKLYGSVEVTG